MGEAKRRKLARARVQRSPAELQRLLQEQIEALTKLGAIFDGGWAGAARPLAVSTGLIVHDTPRSQSLLGQLGLKNRVRFKDTALHIDPKEPDPNESRSRAARATRLWVPETRSGCSVNLHGLGSGSLVGERAAPKLACSRWVGRSRGGQAACRYSLMSPPLVGCRRSG